MDAAAAGPSFVRSPAIPTSSVSLCDQLKVFFLLLCYFWRALLDPQEPPSHPLADFFTLPFFQYRYVLLQMQPLLLLVSWLV